jgi:regulator of protease activity HflC (stomatin/prohibitin superfamily)
MIPGYIFVAVAIIFFLASSVKISKEYERGVIFRLGRVLGQAGVGRFSLEA